MAINAIISGVTVKPDGSVRLALDPYDEGPAGQKALTIVNPPAPPEILECCIGTHIWGGGSSIMVGDTKWAERLTYTRIQLVS